MVEAFGVKGAKFIFGIILARLLTPEDFGLVALLYVFVEVSHSLTNGGFQIALVQKKDLTDTDINSVFYFNVCLGAFFSVLLFFMAGPISDFFNQPKLQEITKYVAIVPILSALCIVQQSLATKSLNMKRIARATMTSVFVSGGCCIYMAYAGYGVWSLVAQQIIAVAVLCLLLWAGSDWLPKRLFSMKSIKRMLDFSSKMLAADFINKVFNNIYYVVIGKLFPPAQLGFYARADNLQKFPSMSLAQTVGRVTFPVLSEVQDDLCRLKNISQKAVCSASFIAFPVMAGLASVADELIPLLLTEKWNPCIPFFQLLCVFGALYPLHMVNLSGIQALGKAGLFLKLEIIKKALVVIGLLVTFKGGILAIVWGQVVVSIVSYFVNLYYNNNLFGYSIPEQLKDIAPFLLGASLMSGTVIWVGNLISFGGLPVILIQAVIGATVYVLLLLLMKNSTIFEFLKLFRKVLSR